MVVESRDQSTVTLMMLRRFWKLNLETSIGVEDELDIGNLVKVNAHCSSGSRPPAWDASCYTTSMHTNYVRR